MWRAWQAQGNPPSPAMSFNLRLCFLGIACGSALAAAFFEKLVVIGPVADCVRRKNPSTGYSGAARRPKVVRERPDGLVTT